jgi:hypothetical protein
VKLATRFFASIGLLVAAAVAGSIIAADVLLRRHLEREIALDLEREARLLAAFTPPDSTRWPEFAQLTGARLGPRHAHRSGVMCAATPSSIAPCSGSCRITAPAPK